MSRRRLRSYLKKGIIIYLVIVPILVAAKPTCPGDMIRTRPTNSVIEDSPLCCYDITCGPGWEPKPCTTKNPNPHCEPCSNGTYQPVITKLSQPQRMKCKRKTDCNVIGSTYRHIGNATVDSDCVCLPGFFCDQTICLPTSRCLIGYGRDAKTGNCLPCALGKTYSDVIDVGDPCKSVTRCEKFGLCTTIRATVQRDAVCGNVTDEGCGEEPAAEPPTPRIKIVTVLVHAPEKENKTPPPIKGETSDTNLGVGKSPPDDKGTDNNHLMIYITVGTSVTLAVIIVAIIIIFVVYHKRMKRKFDKFKKKRDWKDIIKELDKRYLDKENLTVDKEIIEAALDESCASYKQLGDELLGPHKMRELEEIRQENRYLPINMVHMILDEWREKEANDSAMLPNLYSSLKKAKMYDTLQLIYDKLIPSVSTHASDDPLFTGSNTVTERTDSDNIASDIHVSRWSELRKSALRIAQSSNSK